MSLYSKVLFLILVNFLSGQISYPSEFLLNPYDLDSTYNKGLKSNIVAEIHYFVDDLGNSVGGIWLVATDELATIQIAFLRQCREVVNFLNTKYKILWNYVDCRNEVHIKWLKWCGFTFINKTNYGVLNKPFYEFIKICVHQQQD